MLKRKFTVFKLWKGIGFIIHTCVVQYPLCCVGSSMCLHSKVHRSMSLVSLRYVQYSMCYDASSTGLIVAYKVQCSMKMSLLL